MVRIGILRLCQTFPQLKIPKCAIEFLKANPVSIWVCSKDQRIDNWRVSWVCGALPAKPYSIWWVGRDWLRRNFVFKLATNGLKEVVALCLPIYLLA